MIGTAHRLALALAIAATASAQKPKTTPADSTGTDTTRCRCVGRDSVLRRGPVDAPFIPYAMAALSAPPLFLMATDSGSGSAAPFRFLRHHVMLALAGGPVFTQNDALGWTHGEDVEAEAGGVYADARLEHYYLFPQNVRYEVGRVGYLLRTHTAAGGIVIGYRSVYGEPIEGRQQGLEIGLPFVLGDPDRPWRLESYYVVTSPVMTWNYRLQHDWPLRRGPLTLGWKMEAMSFPLRHNSRIAWFTMATMIGIR